MTILAVAALGQMLVIMQAGIDLSTAGVISLCGNVLVGVSANSDSRLALGILASVGVGTLVGLCNGILVAVVRLNPLIVTLATGQVALAWSVRYNREVAANPNVPNALSSWAGHKPVGISAVFWTGAALTLRRRARASLHGRRPALPGGRREPACCVDGRAARPDAHRVRLHRRGRAVRRRGGAARRAAHQHRSGVRGVLSPRADRRGRHRRGGALGGLASATSTWVAALALTFLTQMLLILGLSAALQFIVFGAAIIVGMLVSGDRMASLLGRVLRTIETAPGTRPEMKGDTS